MKTKRRMQFIVPAFLVVLIVISFVFGLWGGEETVQNKSLPEPLPADRQVSEEVEKIIEEQVLHVPTPEEVRGIYWTAPTALGARGQELLTYMLETGLNTVVIDSKMDNGDLLNPDDFVDILNQLKEAGIYRIVRVAVMRDGAFAQENPDIALRAPGGGFWYDAIGSIWVDPAATQVAEYAIDVAQQFYDVGFDEVQFDYVRFPSDGSVNAIVYPVYDDAESKIDVMRRFFARVGGEMMERGIPVSYDLFGMTFWSHDDFNIGQRLADVLPHADWISPMVYPSHYPSGFEGFANPSLHPYEIVKRSLDEGTDLMLDLYSGSEEELRGRWRPWLQDFDIGAVYTSELIEAQIQAARDAGASGWILWNARNVYEPANYK